MQVLEKLTEEVGSVSGKTIAVLGLSFKPNTDDLREAPAVKLINMLLEAGAEVHAYDPVAMENAKRTFGDRVLFYDDSYSAVTGADALVITTEWNEFRVLDLERIKELLKEPVLIDCRNVYKPADAKRLGFRYRSFGRSGG